MKKSKKIISMLVSMLIICMLLMTMTGCGSTSDSKTSATTEITSEVTTEISSETTSESVSKSTAYPVTVTDQAGREITIEKEPEKLVSGYYISSSLLIALGLANKMVGIENTPEKRPIYKLAAPELNELPTVGTAKELDLEGCAALSPDLVILPLKLRDVAQSLEELNIPVLFVNPESSELVTEMIKIVGTATNTQAQADNLITYMNVQNEMISSALSDVDTPVVYLGGNSSLLSTAGPAMYQSCIIDIAGGQNAAGKITDTYWAEISYEQLLTWDPDYIILASDAQYSVDDVMNDPNLKDCSAVKNRNVYAIPGDIEALDSPVPAGFLASIWLAGILHPDKVPADAYTNTMKDYYNNFYGITVE